MSLNKDVLIKELKKSHEEMIKIYSALLEKKSNNGSYLNECIIKNYSNLDLNDGQDFKYNLCYILINKILFVKLCIDKKYIKLGFNFKEDEIKILERIWKNSCKHFYDLNLEYSIREILDFFMNKKTLDFNCNVYKVQLKEELLELINKIQREDLSFSDEDSSILIYIYEQFLLNSNKKSKGKFYTPDYIINYILENTVEHADVIKNPFLKVLDPACGAGNFLIPIYNILKNKFEQNIEQLNSIYKEHVYEVEIDGIITNIKGDKYWKKDMIHYHILKNCIYGADIDKFAVHIAKINLYLQDFESKSGEVNIIDCDSLLKLEEDYEWKNSKAIIFNRIKSKKDYLEDKKFDNKIDIKKFLKQCRFWDNEFDYIVGNPPYVVIIKSSIDEDYWNYIRKNYFTAGYKKNSFYLMIERAIEKLKDGGIHSFVIPDRYFLTNSYENSRKMLIDKTKIINITQIKDKVFGEAIVGAAVYVVKKEKTKENLIELRLNYSMNKYETVFINKEDIEKSAHYVVNILTTNSEIDIIEKIKHCSKSLKDYCKIHVGMMIKNKDDHFKKAEKCINRNPIVLGRDLDKYVINNIRYCNLENINIFGGTKDVSKHNVFPKILLRKTGNNIIASLDDKGILSEQSVYFIIPNNKDLVYNILGQMQSKISNYYFKNYLITNPETYPYIQHYDVERLPINEKVLCNLEYSSCIKNIIALKKQIMYFNYKDILLEYNTDSILKKFEILRNKEKELKYKLKKYKNISNNILFESYNFTREDKDTVLNSEKQCSFAEKSDEEFMLSILENHIKEIIIKEMEKNVFPMTLKEISKSLKLNYKNYEHIVNIIKFKKGKNELDIIKDVLKPCSQSINSYKKKGKIKEMIKLNKYTYSLSL